MIIIKLAVRMPAGPFINVLRGIEKGVTDKEGNTI
jgi:hypothetical protein